MADDTGGAWNEYALLVLEELKRHGSALERVNEQMTQIRVELATLPSLVDRLDGAETLVRDHANQLSALQVKASIWGGLGGLIAALVVLLLKLVG